jgi:hypothetical protein
MKLFEKTYGIRIAVRNARIRNRVLTGKFRMTDGVEYALRVLQREIGFKFERDNENHMICII